MRDIFAVEPSRCHNFDTGNAGARVQRRREHRCDCQAHLLTTSKHKHARSGARYVCQDCGTELAVTGVPDIVPPLARERPVASAIAVCPVP